MCDNHSLEYTNVLNEPAYQTHLSSFYIPCFSMNNFHFFSSFLNKKTSCHHTVEFFCQGLPCSHMSQNRISG